MGSHAKVIPANNTISNSRFAGITFIENSWGNSIFNNTIYNNTYGVFLTDSKFNVFEDLNISNNKYADIMGDPVFEEEGFCTNSFRNVIVTGGQELIVVDTPNIVIDPNYLFTEYGIDDATIPSTQMIVCRDNVTIKDVYMHGDPDYRNNGLFIMGEGRAYNITINNLTATNLMAGVYAQLARNITIQNSTFENNQYGIIFNSVKKGIFSHNVFNENTAAGIFGTTSPAYYFYFDSGFQPEYFYQVSDLLISENEFTNTGYGPSMREAFPTMSGVHGGFITHFVDMGTGSAIQLLLTKNVTVSENIINNASTYGIYAFYTSEINFTNNTINLVNNITEFDPYLLEFDEPPDPEYEAMVDQLKDMLASMPGTGIYLDGANMFTYENVISNNAKGLVSSPVSYAVDVMLTTEFLPELKNYIVNNEFSGSDIGLYLAGNFGDVVYHNKFLNYNYGVQVLSANNVVVDNMFNTTDYYLPFNGSLLNTYNVSEITEENFIVPFDENILRGENIGGNYWGLTNGEGYSDTCDDINPVDGFCDDKFILNTTNNTDYLPLALTSGEPPGPGSGECINLDDVKISPDGNITNEYGDVRYLDGTFYINNDTTICKKTYYTEVDTEVFMYMNGSYELDCNQGLSTVYRMESLSADAIGILNHNSDVTIKNCNFKNFKEGIISTPDPSGGLDTSFGNLLFEIELESDSDSSIDDFRNINLINNFVDGVIRGNDKWYMLSEDSSKIYSTDDYSLIAEWPGDRSAFSIILLSDGKILSYNNESMNLLNADGTGVWGTNILEEEEVIYEYWITRDLPNIPTNVAISADGSKIYYTYDVTETNSNVEYSSDYGENWDVLMSSGFTGIFIDLAVSGDGSKVIATVDNPTGSVYLYDEDIFGSAVVNPAGVPSDYYFAEISDDGNRMIVSLRNHTLYECTSNCYLSGNWNKIYEPPGDEKTIYSMEMSGDGTRLLASHLSSGATVSNLIDHRLVAGSSTGYVSPEDYSFNLLGKDRIAVTNWSVGDVLVTLRNGTYPNINYELFFHNIYNIGASDEWRTANLISPNLFRTLSISNDGQTLYAGLQYGPLYVSQDGGNTWIETTTNKYWLETDISADGTKGIGITGQYNIYLYNESSEVVTTTVSTVANVYEHPTTGNLYAYLLEGSFDAGTRKAHIIAYDISTGDKLWNITIENPIMYKGTLVFNDEGNLVVLYNGQDVVEPPETETKLIILNYTNGDILSNEDYPGTYNWINKYPYMFIDTDGYIYDFSMDFVDGPANPLRKIILQKYKEDGTDYSNETFEVPYIDIGFDSGSRDVNVLFDGEYIYYTASDDLTGTSRLYYKVFDLDLNEVASGEFKPNSENVEFSSYLNEMNEVEFLGNFVGNNSYEDYRYNYGYNFVAILNKSNEFEFTMINPVYIQEDHEQLVPLHEFIEIDDEGNTVVVGYERYPRTSRIKISKFSDDGTLLYNVTYSPDARGNALPLDFLINDDGNYVIGGYYTDLNDYEEKYFVALFDESNGYVLDYSVFVSEGELPDLDMFELDDSYTVIVGSSMIFNITKSDFSSEYIDILSNYSAGLKLSFDGEKVAMIGKSDTSDILNFGLYTKNLTELFVIPLGGSEGIYGEYPYGVYVTNDGINDTIYIYFSFYDSSGEGTRLNKYVDSVLETFEKIKDLLIYDIRTNDKGDTYILAQVDDDFEGLSVFLVEANATGGFDLTPVSKVDSIIPIGMAVNDDFFSVIGANLEIFTSGGNFYINRLDSYIYSETFADENVNWESSYLGITLSSTMEELFATFYVDAGAVNIVPMGDNYLVSVLRLSDYSGDEPIIKPVFYEVNKYGDYELLFAFDKPYYPAKSIVIGDNIYVLMLNSTKIGETGDGDYRELDIGVGNYIIYSFKKDGTVNWDIVTELYNAGFTDFGSLWYYPEAMAYDEITKKLIVSGSSFEIVEIEEEPQPILTNVSVMTITLNGNSETKDITSEMSEFGIEYPINLISGINVIDEGYLIVGGFFAGEKYLASYVIKTNRNVDVQWAQITINGTVENICEGGWEYVSGFEDASLTSLTISKDGSVMVAGNETMEGWEIVYDFIKSYDNGSTWESFGPVVPFDKEIISISLSEDGTSALVSMYDFTVSKGAVSYTDNFADETPTWETLENNHLFVTAISADGQYMFAGSETNGTLYNCDKSTQDCTDWNNWNEIFDSSHVFGLSLAVSGDGSTIVYVVFNDSIGSEEVYISTKGGDFSLISDAPMIGKINDNSIAISNDGSKILVGTYDGIYLSSDGGEFENVINVSEGLVSSRVSMSSDGNDMMAFISSRLHYSTNGGSTWAEVRPTGLDENKDWLGLGIDDNGFRVAYFEDEFGDNGLYIFTDPSEEVCESLIVGDPYAYFPIKSFYVDSVGDGLLFMTVSDFKVNASTNNMDSAFTFIVDATNGHVLAEFEQPFSKAVIDDILIQGFLYAQNYGHMGVYPYMKVSKSKFTSLATMRDSLIMPGNLVVDNIRYKLFDFEPTSYGIIGVGSYLFGSDEIDLQPIVQGYSFKKVYSDPPLENIVLSNNGILKDDGVLLVDLSSSDTEIISLLVGSGNSKCFVKFLNIGSMNGSLWFGDNIWWDKAGSFISIDSQNGDAAAFNVPSIVRLSYPPGAKIFSVVGSNESCTTRQCVLDTGVNLPDIVLDCPVSATFCEFEVSGWSSYTLGYVDPSTDPGSKSSYKYYTDLLYDKEMCINEMYELMVTDNSMYLPIRDARVTIYDPYYYTTELITSIDGKVFFTPTVKGNHRLKVDDIGDYRGISLSENYHFTAIDCSIPDECSLVTKENYILVEDWPACKEECSITECPDGLELVDDALGCRCVILTCPAPEENYKFVINDWPTCTYECVIDQDYCETEFGVDYVFDEIDCKCVFDDSLSEMDFEIYQDIDLPDIELGVNEVCVGLPFIVDVVSLDRDCLVDTQLDIPAAGIYGKTTLDNVVISELGTYEATLMKSGCRTTRGFIKVIDCGEMEYEDPFDVPVETAFFEDIINIFRNSIKGGCEGFYFEGIPTILCDLVWVIVIIGSLGAAYLEPLKNRKVISLVTPSVVAIVLIPLAGAIAAAGFVYLAYNSKKHVESKLEYEREQMEEEINKE